MMENERVCDLPPGFSFDPTDEELVFYFLKSKIAANLPFHIPLVDFSSSDPWQLHERALWSKNQWYFFSQVKENSIRATGRGYWKELNRNEPIMLKNCGEKLIGIKKYFVYSTCTNNIHEQVETNWIMEEFHLSSFNKPEKEKQLEWVICRVHESSKDCEGINCDEVELSALDELFLSLDDDQEQDEISYPY
ncbi:unnamed protein product [Withania somnifera]